MSALLDYTGRVVGSVGATAASPDNALINSSSPSSSPSTRSPVKSRSHRNSEESNSTAAIMKVSDPHQSNSQSVPHPDPIAQFPTPGQPISDVTLKEMLMSLRSSIQSDMISCIQKCRAEVQDLGEFIRLRIK